MEFLPWHTQDNISQLAEKCTSKLRDLPWSWPPPSFRPHLRVSPFSSQDLLPYVSSNGLLHGTPVWM